MKNHDNPSNTKLNILPWDGHTHGPFCKHGSSDPHDSYVKKAIEQGLTGMTLTEHPPLPDGYLVQPEIQIKLAMTQEEWPMYLKTAWKIKETYHHLLHIKVGAELDYLPNRTDYTLSLFEKNEHLIEEAILSIHYLPGIGGMRCVDWSAADIQEGLIKYYGSYDKMIEVYYEHVFAAVEWSSNLPVPVRLGHLTLYKKFQNDIPQALELEDSTWISSLLFKLKDHSIGLDVNAAGRDLETCKEWYLPSWAIQEAKNYGISLVYGSDAHHPSKVGRYFNELQADHV